MRIMIWVACTRSNDMLSPVVAWGRILEGVDRQMHGNEFLTLPCMRMCDIQ